jgi:hypothetical protein
MTEIEVEDIAGRLGQHFRRVFHAREGALELHLSILEGVAARYRTPALFRAQAIQPPADWCLPCAAHLAGQVDRRRWRLLSFISELMRTIVMSSYVDMRPC